MHYRRPMKYFLFKYLLFAVLMSGTVLPVHAYAHSFDSTTSEQQQLTEDTDNQDDVQATNCDHCCHFSSHSVGLHMSNHVGQFANKGSILVTSHITYRSLKAEPPYYPPILA